MLAFDDVDNDDNYDTDNGNYNDDNNVASTVTLLTCLGNLPINEHKIFFFDSTRFQEYLNSKVLAHPNI